MGECYTEPIKMRNTLQFLSFPHYERLSESQQRNIHQNLTHRSVERRMRFNEISDIDCVPNSTGKEIVKIARHCPACRLKQGKLRRFLFCSCDSVIRELNHAL